MKTAIAAIILIWCNASFASSAYWTGIHLSKAGIYQGTQPYSISSTIYGQNGHAELFSDLYGHKEGGRLYLKHDDFSLESIEPTFNWWVLAVYGEVVGEESFAAGRPNHIEDARNNFNVGGTPVENPSDFYMAFKASEVIFVSGVGYEEGESWYGWVHVSVDDELNMTLLGEGINLYGEPVVVGMLPIPEPSAGMLLLLGLAGLALRRKTFRTSKWFASRRNQSL